MQEKSDFPTVDTEKLVMQRSYPSYGSEQKYADSIKGQYAESSDDASFGLKKLRENDHQLVQQKLENLNKAFLELFELRAGDIVD